MEEQKKEQMSHSYWRGHCSHWGCWAVKILVVVAVIAIAFGLGVKAGVWKANLGYGGFGHSIIGGRIGDYDSMRAMQYGMMGGNWGWFRGDKEKGTTRLFGVIDGISGNQITITDNSANTQTIVSTADTDIVFDNQAISITSLKEGQSILAIGTLNTDNQLQAKLIQVYSL